MVKWPFGARRGAAKAAPEGAASAGQENDRTTGAAPKPASPKSASPRPASRVTFWIGLICAVVSIAWSVGTYLILTGLIPVSVSLSVEVVAIILMLNVVPILATAGITAWHGAGLWRARRRQAAGSELHVRIVGLFGVIAVLPAIFVAVMASVALDRGLNVVFSGRTTAIVRNSESVAVAYMRELMANVRTDSVNLAKELETSAALMKEDRNGFISLFKAESALRNLRQAYLVDGDGHVILAAQGDPERVEGGQAPPKESLRKALGEADKGRMVIIEPDTSGARPGGPPLTVTGAAALKKLNNFENTYLYVVRPVRPEVTRHVINTMVDTAIYDTLKANRKQLQLANGIMYVAVTLALLLAAIWLGMWFANRLVAPIQQLIGAAQEVSHGNLDVQVEVGPRRGDLEQLGSSFNKMTSELRSQRDELVETNATLDERRRFIEAVLSGVTAGVIGVDANGIITLANRSAIVMLGVEYGNLIGARLEDAAPEFGELLNKSSKQGRKPAQAQISLMRHGTERSFAVRITREGEDKQDYGLVVTFDDISELVVAQRTSAWADVARRLAHEIKNPLTPIQLSAERIRRKYGSSISKDREIFDRCTDTIIRHVGDIGRMVDEFSSFARMPKPDFEAHNLAEIVREAVILFQMSHPEIKYVIDAPKEPSITLCDRRLITQAVTNLVKNAGEAIAAAVQSGSRGPGYKGRITARLRALEGRFTIEVMDNGVGLPKENRYRLVEPYVTTRQKGTGLGLAIVQRITEQHGGLLELEDAPAANGDSSGGASGDGAGTDGRQGALVRLTLPANRASEGVARVAKNNAGLDSEAALNAAQG